MKRGTAAGLLLLANSEDLSSQIGTHRFERLFTVRLRAHPILHLCQDLIVHIVRHCPELRMELLPKVFKRGSVRDGLLPCQIARVDGKRRSAFFQ